MLRLLLDEHLSPVIGQQLRRHHPLIAITSMHEWHDGVYLGVDDEDILKAAHAEKLTLITYDQQTIKPLLRRWGAAGDDHSGVVFVSNRTIASQNFGGLVRAIGDLWEQERDEEWLNRVRYLEIA